ncbi:hypothetical protein QQF64_024126 [Cirrhinus molitorella]|uniref:Uncharacterized protein n=1 Tax=Cirrhinus molitorella TaxID=172907 RepID=A0ABR3NKC9_9TELE
MEFIKEETEDVKIEETFRVKHEETEEQIDLMPLKEECKELNEVEKKEEYETHSDSKVLELLRKRHDHHFASDETEEQSITNSEKSAVIDMIGKESTYS